jgi:hypothetical protein
MRHYLKVFILSFLLLPFFTEAQPVSAFAKFKQLSRPEKWWTIMHPFVAKKALKITQNILKVTDSIAYIKTLDGDRNGGQVDAFRHSYWMASLAQRIGWRRALKLGRAHERSNYIDYKKHRLEEGAVPDKASGDMDLFNNDVGIRFGRKYKDATELEMKIMIVDAVVVGVMKIIKKDSLGNFFDEKNNVIPADSLKEKWNNGKCLVKSNWKIQ